MAERLGEILDQEALSQKETTPEEFDPGKAKLKLEKAFELIVKSDMPAEQRANLSPKEKRLNEEYETNIGNALSELRRAFDPLEKLKIERENS